MSSQKQDFLWMDVSEDRTLLLSSLALEHRSQGSQSHWYPVRVDEKGAAWRLGTPRFLEKTEARSYVEELASHDPTNALMKVSPGVDPAAIGAAAMVSSALSMLLFYLPLGIHPSFLAPISVFLTTVCILAAWGTEHLEDPNAD